MTIITLLAGLLENSLIRSYSVSNSWLLVIHGSLKGVFNSFFALLLFIPKAITYHLK